MALSQRARRLIAVLATTLALSTSATPALAQAESMTADRAAMSPRIATSVTKTVVMANIQAVLKLRAQLARIAYAKATRTAVLKVARAQIGDPYIAGRAGPDAFDCGGFVQFVFDRAVGMDLNRTSWQQYAQVKKIKRKNAQPGDLVFFFEGGAHHVGIYIGKGKMIDAPRRGQKVRVSPITGSWWGRSYTGMGRILPAV
ncbi:MAG: NlpC/P60 family protein [Actinobacteria bacterium]|nr:NlpC/P60 family protein [Actinomycetota bacterium]